MTKKSLSVKKAWRQSLRRRQRNRAVHSAIKTQIRKAENLIFDGEPDEAAVRRAISALDRATAKGIIHPNNAARRKARLMKKYNAALAQAAPQL